MIILKTKFKKNIKTIFRRLSSVKAISKWSESYTELMFHPDTRKSVDARTLSVEICWDCGNFLPALPHQIEEILCWTYPICCNLLWKFSICLTTWVFWVTFLLPLPQFPHTQPKVKIVYTCHHCHQPKNKKNASIFCLLVGNL